MKNYEKYADEIKKYKGYGFCENFVLPRVLKSSNCLGNNDLQCSSCHMKQMLWLMEEYEEPEVDWSKVKVDTPILVKDIEYENWRRRYFAAYKDGVVYAWISGKTSWSVNDGQETNSWGFAKLAESEEGGVK